MNGKSNQSDVSIPTPQARLKADYIHQSFEDKSDLDVREYISRKNGLYMEAGETNQENIVRRIHDGLDVRWR